MKLNGWQRLWVILSGFYLLIIIIFSLTEYPTIEKIQHKPELLSELPSHLKEKIIREDDWIPYYPPDNKKNNSKATNASYKSKNKKELINQMPNGYVFYFFPEATKDDISAIKKTYLDALKKELRSKKTILFILSTIFWIVPCLTLYVFGWLVGWIYRGFKQT